jgi:RND superfamily putative drug exporter
MIVALLPAPVRSLDLGQSDNGQLPVNTTARQAYDLLSDGFGPGFNGPLLVAVSRSQRGNDRSATLTRFAASLTGVHGVVAVSPPLLSKDGSDAVLSVIPTCAPSAQATVTVVHALRDTVISTATRATGLTAYVGGTTAGFVDLSSAIADRLPLVIAIVLAFSFLLLLTAFRAPLVALKAVVMNLLSIAAAFGVVT